MALISLAAASLTGVGDAAALAHRADARREADDEDEDEEADEDDDEDDDEDEADDDDEDIDDDDNFSGDETVVAAVCFRVVAAVPAPVPV